MRSSPCPVPYLRSSPHLHAACAAIARRLPPLPARTSPRTVCPPFDSRQRAYSLSDANKLLVRCAWAGTSAFATAGYGSSWGPGTCPATFTTKASLKTAVEAYNANPTTAIATYGPIALWGVSGITDMGGLFKDLKNFDADVSSWDTSSVTTMYQMFYGASTFNQPLRFDTSSVTNMQDMFRVRSTPVMPHICRRASTARWTPSPPICWPAPRTAPYAPFRLSAGRVGIQPAAELQHFQRHGHVRHVPGALHGLFCP